MVWTSKYHAVFVSLGALVFLLISEIAQACTPDEGWQQMQAEEADVGEVYVRIVTGDIPLNRPFGIEIATCFAKGRQFERIRVDATMPAHQHGMNYNPVISLGDNGIFVADGFLFHMPGVWRVAVSGLVDGSTRGYFIDLKIR